STDGGYQPRWRRDSTELLYVTGDGTFMSVDVTTTGGFKASPPKKLFSVPIYGRGTNTGQTRWDLTPDGQKVSYQYNRTGVRLRPSHGCRSLAARVEEQVIA